MLGTQQEGAIGHLTRHPAGIGRHPDTVRAGRASTAVRRNATEATRIVAHCKGWHVDGDAVADHQGPLAYSIEDLARFAESAGWIGYRGFTRGFCVHWTSVPKDPEAAAAQARAGLDDEGKHPDRWTTLPVRSR